MVKPGGTGKPRYAISARPAPLPPRSLRISARPSAFPLPKLYTHFISPGDFLRAADRARAAGLRPEAERVDVLFNRLRRDDTAMEPQLDAPALDVHRRARRRKGADRAPAVAASPDEVMDAVEARDADDDQIDCYDIIQQPREEQNQNAGDERNKRRDMCKGDGHRDLLGWQSMIMTPSMAGSTRGASFYSGVMIRVSA